MRVLRMKKPILEDLMYKEMCEGCDDKKYFHVSCFECENLVEKGFILALEWCKEQIQNDVNGFFNICREMEHYEKIK